MALQDVDLRELLADYIVNGGGNGALTVEGGVVGVGVHVCLVEVDVIVADEAVLVPALHHQTVVLYRLVGVLLCKGGVDIGVLFLHRNVVGETFVFVQQVLNDLILLAGLNDPVDGHVLFQSIDHYLGVTGNGVELGGADIVLGQGGGQRRDQNVDHNHQRQYHGGDDQRVGASLEGNVIFGCLAGRRETVVLFHQLYLLFSRDCTERKRKNPITVR